ncbi:uncharacterized protein FOMMEDRAFT_156365 [Fomitiporia mediterranea MF3/22]|uniref:uncharacterized protein n=1 Tax=Fomitiporia mediterranea (strain MF3/22) TaxID=694068 RepID=UPI0004409490|nr:uncharacterized protein FOMMEDRAFT_156365 [Fomitiporia mediterranea MF3/22]EJD03007.1 hypothetical protein FOMMEDRAFT_156365 [Fomitiporia mediterranea MF3/22]
MASSSDSQAFSTSSPETDSKIKYDVDIERQVDCDKEVAPETFYASKYGALGPMFAKLFDSGVEARGIERVPEDQRDPKNTWNKSVNTTLTAIPVGTLAQGLFTLTFPHAVATILCFGALGAAASAFVATLGPKTGMRTMIITRYSSSLIGCTIYSILNILTQLGFATTCLILGGQTLASINPGTLPLTVAIIIIAVGSLIPCLVGYNLVHFYERYAWIVVAVIMLMLLGLGAQAGFDVSSQKASEDEGRSLAADILSFGGIVYGSSSWAQVAADFNCQLPASISSTKVFVLTFFGIFIPTTLVEILGAVLMTISDPAYSTAFENGGTGGLLSQVLSPWKGGGKFLLTLLALSAIANNIPGTYAIGLCTQALGRPFALVPRFIWTFLAFVIYTIASVAGREHFAEILSNFLSILSYWIAFFVVIMAEEHFIFRRKGGRLGGYDLEAYDDRNKLPLGVAGVMAGCCGVLGAIVGMSEKWYVGPIAAKIGPAGADLGFELAAVFAAVTYPPLRWLEIQLTGR